MNTLLDSYVYRVDVEWTGRRAGRVEADGLPDLAVSAPPEFLGDAGIWTPEHLLVAATASCLMATFLGVAELHKLSVASYESRAFARLEKIPGEGYRFTEITLAPEIGVASEDLEKAEKVLARAARNCFISNSLRAEVRIEPHFVAARAALSR